MKRLVVVLLFAASALSSFGQAAKFVATDFSRYANSTILDDAYTSLTVSIWFRPSITLSATTAYNYILFDKTNKDSNPYDIPLYLTFVGAVGSFPSNYGMFDHYTFANSGSPHHCATTTTTWTAGALYHIVIMTQPTGGIAGKRIYVNGTLENSQAYSAAVKAGSGRDFNYGNATWSGNPSFLGVIEQTKIWTRTFSDSEVMDMYARRGSDRFSESLFAWWEGDMRVGLNVAIGGIMDLSGNNNTLTLLGGSTYALGADSYLRRKVIGR